LVYNSTTKKWEPGTVSSSGFTLLPATGAIDDTNTDYTFTEKPTYIIQNSVWYRENLGWTWNAGTLTATMAVPTQTGSDIFAFK
jgi:hypothetical protein